MSRSVRLAFAALTTFLALLPLTLAKPGLPVNLKADEPAYYLMARSLASDHDLRLEVKDVDRVFEEFPLVPANNLIVMSDDGWRTVYFSKPLLYPLLGAPFVAALGANGLLFLNMLLVAAMVWMGATYLRRHNDDGISLLVAGAFTVLSCGFAYAFWIHTEIFCMTAVAAACFPVMGASERERRVSLLAPLASGAALALAAYNKPMYGLLGAALLLPVWRGWRWRGVLSWAAGAAATLGMTGLLAVALTGRPTPYLGSQARAGISICSQGKLPIEPDPVAAAPVSAAAAKGAAATAAGGGAPPPRLNWGFVLRPPSIDLRELAENAAYFLWGRHTGFFLYFPFGVLAVVLFAIDGARDRERWLLLAALAAIALYFLVFIPVNWQGGGGFIGNRYYAPLYPAFLYLVRRVRPTFLVLPATVSASLFLGPLLLSPFGAAVPEPTLQSHVRNAPFRFFPLELSLKNMPGYEGFPLGDARLLARRDQIVPLGESMWLRGSDRVEVWIESATRVERPTLLLESFGRNRVTVTLNDSSESIEFAGPGEQHKVVLRPSRPTRRRFRDGTESWVYRLVVHSAGGSIVSWTRGRTARGCGEYRFEDPKTESFFAGAALTYLGDADHHEVDLFNPAWGELTIPARVTAGSVFDVDTVVTNASPHPWRATGSARIHLSYHWLTPDGVVVVVDGRRTDLPETVGPGETVRVSQTIEAPGEPGSYLLEIDLVYEHVAWFAQRNGGRTHRGPVEVVASSEAE
ncbi:MAG TPA: hypothetical protein VHR17_10870 [Thermoanaerobaculia bacterium]|nr:hypothetical protein [Thermoanaerobaculia bacterium]